MDLFEGKDIATKKQKRKVHGETMDVEILYAYFYDPIEAHSTLNVNVKETDGSLVWLSPRVFREGGWFACVRAADTANCTVVQGRYMDGGEEEDVRAIEVHFRDRTVRLANCIVESYATGSDDKEKWMPVTVSLNIGTGVLSVKWQTSYVRAESFIFTE